LEKALCHAIVAFGALSGAVMLVVALLLVALFLADAESVAKLWTLLQTVGIYFTGFTAAIVGWYALACGIAALKGHVPSHQKAGADDKMRHEAMMAVKANEAAMQRLGSDVLAYLQKLAPRVDLCRQSDCISFSRLERVFARVIRHSDEFVIRVYLGLSRKDEARALRQRGGGIVGSDVPDWGNAMLLIHEKKDLRRLRPWLQKSCARRRL